MKQTLATAIVLAATAATTANADNRISRFCGDGHEIEIASAFDVNSNPDGYFVVSLAEQISEGDPRIILTNASEFHLCTTGVATPEMSVNEVYRLDQSRKVKFLFVPISGWSERPGS